MRTWRVIKRGKTSTSSVRNMSSKLYIGRIVRDKLRIVRKTIHSPFSFCYRYHFGSSDMESKLRAIQTVSVLLQGPSDVGNRTLELSGIIDAVISLCASENITQQQVAVEALIHASGKAKRASFITANGVALLKDLYKKSENDRIRVRALVVSVQTQKTSTFREIYLFFLNSVRLACVL